MSDTQICNRGLSKLGARRITSLSENSVVARACASAYNSLREAELRAHPWAFAIARAALAADATVPDWGRANAFTLPADYLRLTDDYEEDLWFKDWVIEQGKILTNDTAPIYIRYIKNITDTTKMDALFKEALATRIAMELCEELTQSNTKKADLELQYTLSVKEARRVNAIERRAIEAPQDDWITKRL